MQDFLKHLRVGNEALPFEEALLEPSLSVRLVGMGSSDQVHGNVGIDKDQREGSPMYPLSISESICAMSLVG